MLRCSQSRPVSERVGGGKTPASIGVLCTPYELAGAVALHSLPPLWGRVGVGGCARRRLSYRYPPPWPSPILFGSEFAVEMHRPKIECVCTSVCSGRATHTDSSRAFGPRWIHRAQQRTPRTAKAMP